MISKSAVTLYIKELQLKCRNSRTSWLKRATFRQVEKATKRFYHPKFSFKTEPYFHQLVCFHLGIRFACWMFMLDMGLGKSKIALDIATHYVLTGDVRRVLVVVPTDVNVGSWEDDAPIHCDLPIIGTYGSVPDKLDTIEDLPDVCVVLVTYPALMHMCSSAVPINKKGRTKMLLNRDAVDWVASQFEMVVFDESHYARNHETLLWEVCNEVRRRVSKAYGLTGTPLGSTALDLWAQFKLMTGEETFPGTFEIFRASLFNAVETNGKFKWKLRKGSYRIIRSLISLRGIRYSDKEVDDVPETIPQVRNIAWTDEGFEYYKGVGEATFFGEDVPMEMRARSYHTMRGLASGYMKWLDESGELFVFELDKNPKWEALLEIYEALPAGRKLIVFYMYLYTGQMLERLFTEQGVEVMRVDGTTKKNHERIRDWQRPSGPRVLVGNCQSIGTGANLQVTNYGVFFESTSNPIIRRQAEKRFSGARQKNYNVAHIIDLCMKGSLEPKILESIAEGVDLFSSVIDGSTETEGDKTPTSVKKTAAIKRVMAKSRPDPKHRRTARVMKIKRRGK